MTGQKGINKTEKQAALSLAAVFSVRMLGLFLILPVFSLYATTLENSTPLLIGLALGAYGFTQAMLQIPFGWLSDRVGRKPVIVAGLLIFALGSVIAASATDIWLIILGRAIQGAGAIAAVIMALLADLTREEHRSKAMAIIGMTIGFAFSVAMVAGPVLNDWIGVDGIFWLTGVLALVSIVVVLFLVPTPASHMFQRDSIPAPDRILSVLKDSQLLRLDVSILVLHMLLTQVFLVFPLSLVASGNAATEHWKLYLPVMLVAMLLMVPFIIVAEKKAKMKPVFMLAIALLIAGLALFGLSDGFWMLVIGLLLFFTGFNILEASLPSLVSKLSPVDGKGTAMGVYSTSQFLGAFLGGVLGGFVHQHYGISNVYWAAVVITMIWFIIALGLKNVPRIRNRVMSIASEQMMKIKNELEQMEGITQLVAISEEDKLYIKYDADKLEDEILDQLEQKYT